MRSELKAIQARLTELLGKNSHEVFHLKVRLNCRNCKNSDCKANVWICNLYGEIPKEFIEEGCDSWINNIAIKR
jgi:hypothetical protein